MKKLVSLMLVIFMLFTIGSEVFANNEVYNSQSTQNIVDFIWPTQSKRITSPYGWRTHPITGVETFHNGVDIGRITDSDPVWSAGNGVVVFAGNATGYGNIVIVNSYWQGIVIQTRYAHLRSIDVKENQNVTKGTRIGIMGQTGNVTGIHLHYEVREVNSLNSVWEGSTMDPVMFHDFIDNGGGIQSIDYFMSMDGKNDTKVGYSDTGYGLSIGDRFLTVDYILSTPIDKLKLLGLTAKDVSLLIDNNITEINLIQLEALKKLRKLFEER